MGGHFYVFTLLHVLEHSEHFCFCLLFWWEKINYFHGWGGLPRPFSENSAKIINLIFEPFPNIIRSILNLSNLMRTVLSFSVYLAAHEVQSRREGFIKKIILREFFANGGGVHLSMKIFMIHT